VFLLFLPFVFFFEDILFPHSATLAANQISTPRTPVSKNFYP